MTDGHPHPHPAAPAAAHGHGAQPQVVDFTGSDLKFNRPRRTVSSAGSSSPHASRFGVTTQVGSPGVARSRIGGPGAAAPAGPRREASDSTLPYIPPLKAREPLKHLPHTSTHYALANRHAGGTTQASATSPASGAAAAVSTGGKSASRPSTAPGDRPRSPHRADGVHSGTMTPTRGSSSSASAQSAAAQRRPGSASPSHLGTRTNSATTPSRIPRRTEGAVTPPSRIAARGTSPSGGAPRPSSPHRSRIHAADPPPNKSSSFSSISDLLRRPEESSTALAAPAQQQQQLPQMQIGDAVDDATVHRTIAELMAAKDEVSVNRALDSLLPMTSPALAAACTATEFVGFLLSAVKTYAKQPALCAKLFQFINNLVQLNDQFSAVLVSLGGLSVVLQAGTMACGSSARRQSQDRMANIESGPSQTQLQLQLQPRAVGQAPRSRSLSAASMNDMGSDYMFSRMSFSSQDFQRRYLRKADTLLEQRSTSDENLIDSLLSSYLDSRFLDYVEKMDKEERTNTVKHLLILFAKVGRLLTVSTYSVELEMKSAMRKLLEETLEITHAEAAFVYFLDNRTSELILEDVAVSAHVSGAARAESVKDLSASASGSATAAAAAAAMVTKTLGSGTSLNSSSASATSAVLAAALPVAAAVPAPPGHLFAFPNGTRFALGRGIASACIQRDALINIRYSSADAGTVDREVDGLGCEPIVGLLAIPLRHSDGRPLGCLVALNKLCHPGEVNMARLRHAATPAATVAAPAAATTCAVATCATSETAAEAVSLTLAKVATAAGAGIDSAVGATPTTGSPPTPSTGSNPSLAPASTTGAAPEPSTAAPPPPAVAPITLPLPPGFSRQPFSHEDDFLFRILRIQTEMIVSNAASYDNMKRTQKKVEVLLDTTRSLSSQLQLESLIQEIMRAAKELLGADRCTLFLLDEANNQLWSQIPDKDGRMKHIRFPSTVGIAGAVATTGTPINIPDAYADARFNPDVDKQTGYKTSSILCMPIKNADGAIVGVTQMINKLAGIFSHDDEQLLDAFSAQAAVAIEKSVLFQQTERMRDYLDSILQSLSPCVVSLSQQLKLNTINRPWLIDFLGTPRETMANQPIDAWLGDANAMMLQDIRSVLATGTSAYSADYELKGTGGATKIINYNIVRHIGGQGLVVIIEDISNERRALSTLSRYMSPELAKMVMQEGSAQLGGVRKQVSVLFSDVRGFTEISEALKPHEVVELLNEHFTHCVNSIVAEGGILDKFIGDAIMAVFGVPFVNPDDAIHACNTALRMVADLEAWNQRRSAAGLPTIAIGIGINTGEVLSGNIGSEKRMEFSCIGDAVNLSSRVEGLTKFYGVTIMITAHTRDETRGAFVTRELDTVRPVGKKQPIVMYELVARAGEAVDATRAAVIDAYEAALKLYYAGEFEAAADRFEAVGVIAKDKPAELMLRRCRKFIGDPELRKAFNGVYVADSK
ncbi:hypothetical protein H9P43_000903 [Blastocladiella emersonii ATCC 22665]|nr:hypothetical protein H9P43_000903 [Blastocladiella emersonii ATCC 22665]